MTSSSYLRPAARRGAPDSLQAHLFLTPWPFALETGRPGVALVSPCCGSNLTVAGVGGGRTGMVCVSCIAEAPIPLTPDRLDLRASWDGLEAKLEAWVAPHFPVLEASLVAHEIADALRAVRPVEEA